MLLPQDILSQKIVLVNGHSDGNDVADVLVYYEGCKRIVNDRVLIQPNNSAPFSDATKDRLQLRQFLSVGFVTVVFVFQPDVVYRHTLKSPPKLLSTLMLFVKQSDLMCFRVLYT
jgi:hypothetical protein